MRETERESQRERSGVGERDLVDIREELGLGCARIPTEKDVDIWSLVCSLLSSLPLFSSLLLQALSLLAIALEIHGILLLISHPLPSSLLLLLQKLLLVLLILLPSWGSSKELTKNSFLDIL
jgi:hypothetical protein